MLEPAVDGKSSHESIKIVLMSIFKGRDKTLLVTSQREWEWVSHSERSPSGWPPSGLPAPFLGLTSGGTEPPGAEQSEGMLSKFRRLLGTLLTLSYSAPATIRDFLKTSALAEVAAKMLSETLVSLCFLRFKLNEHSVFSVIVLALPGSLSG